ncbi:MULTISPECIES: DUF131 domain-containing protein [Methanobacterium]|uniref:TIGR00304 family membrane protein n=1 Tax=Methanobacterium TaxID=2160 RepID=UPI001E4B6C96|nr:MULTISPECIES: DUF131 domain-containing protein [Methanobacterium]
MSIVTVVVGMLIIFIGSAFLSSGKTDSDNNIKVSTGGVVLIGLIPIVFGNNKSMISVTVLGAIILMILGLHPVLPGAYLKLLNKGNDLRCK